MKCPECEGCLIEDQGSFWCRLCSWRGWICKLIPTYTGLYMLLAISVILTGCQPKERPDELEMMTKDVLKSKRGIVIDIEPGQSEK